MDGWITIGTKLDTKQLEQDLKQQERQLQQFEKEEEKLLQKKAKLELDTKDAEEGLRLIEQTIQQLKNEMAEMEAQGGDFTNSQEYLNKLEEIKMLEQTREDGLEAIRSKHEEINHEIEMNKIKQGLVREEVEKTNNELNQSEGYHNLKDVIADIGKETDKNVKKIGKWALAVIGIRSAYMLVRQAMSTLSQYDKQLAANIEYIRYALAMVLKPLIEWIVNEVYKILQYINYIANAWFGINLFKNASIDNFNKGLGSATKKAKELQKILTKFDEATVLQDTKDSGSSSGGGIPSMDLSKMGQVEIPDWVKWIAEHKDLIMELAGIVGIAFGTGKTLELLSNIGKIMGFAGPAAGVGGSGLAGLFTSIAAIAAIAAGIVVIVTIAKYIWDDLEKLGNEIDQISEKQAKFNQGWKKSIDPVKDLNKLIGTVGVNITNGRDNLKSANSWWTKIRGNSEKYLNVAQRVVESSQATVEKAKEMYEYEGRTKEEKQKILNMLIQQYNYNQDVIKALEQEGKDTSNLKDITQNYRNLILQISGDLYGVNEKTEEQKDKWNEVNDAVDGVTDKVNDLNNQKIKDKSFTINGTTKINDANLSKALDKAILIGSGLAGTFMPSVWSNILKQITSWRNRLGLATGGIVSLPGRGVPIANNVVAGERGREGVIPLTDPNAMSQLGEEIGRWVNLAIDNKMVVDGRVLATATNNQINKENFLMNR